jgi:hypothetical protein
MSTAATGRGPPVSQLLSAIKKFLQDAIIDAGYVWSREISRVKGLKLVFSESRRLSTWLRSDEQSNTGIVTDRVAFSSTFWSKMFPKSSA